MKHRPRTYLLIGGVNVSSILWSAAFFVLGAAIMLGILIGLTILGWRGGL